MPEERIADLDELVLRCKDVQSRDYIAEAVACYRAGAYRASIVATWIAVVFDFLHKLRELERTGDPMARAVLEEFEKVRGSSDVASSLRFEREMLEQMEKQFELISPLERIDLQRLLDDRHRCAHPSMNTLDEPYQPSAELARTHLRNAITYVLQHPPVQGKAALDRLMSDIRSEYFPKVVDDAVRYFKSGPLSRPRAALVRNLVIVLMKDLLPKEAPANLRPQDAVALSAMRKMHREVTESVMRDRLSDIMRQVPDAHMHVALEFLLAIPDTWQFIEDDVATRLRTYVQHMPDGDVPQALPMALGIRELRKDALQRLQGVSAADLAHLVELAPDEARAEDLIDKALDFYSKAVNYDTANKTAKSLVLPLIPFMSEAQVQRLIESARENDQITGSFEFPTVLRKLRSSTKISEADFNELTEEFGMA